VNESGLAFEDAGEPMKICVLDGTYVSSITSGVNRTRRIEGSC